MGMHLTLGFPGLDTQFVLGALHEAGCDPHPGEYGIKDTDHVPRFTRWAMDLDQFIQLYSHCIERGSRDGRSSAMARQLEKAFATFDTDNSGVLARADMRSILLRMASAPLDEQRLDEVLDELSGNADEMADGMITIASFSRWMMSTYMSFLKDPSLVHDSMERWQDFAVYNQ